MTHLQISYYLTYIIVIEKTISYWLFHPFTVIFLICMICIMWHVYWIEIDGMIWMNYEAMLNEIDEYCVTDENDRYFQYYHLRSILHICISFLLNDDNDYYYYQFCFTVASNLNMWNCIVLDKISCNIHTTMQQRHSKDFRNWITLPSQANSSNDLSMKLLKA